MEPVYFCDMTFEKDSFNLTPLATGEYENCIFNQCDFSNADFSGMLFTDCEFRSCNLSLIKFFKTALRNIVFNDCKMLGLHFEHCNQFGLALNANHCILNHSSFYKTILRKISFSKCQLHETDFTECDLTGAIFDECDLMNASFDHSVLEKADFRTAFNYSIDPETNRIKKAMFSSSGLEGLLRKYDLLIE